MFKYCIQANDSFSRTGPPSCSLPPPSQPLATSCMAISTRGHKGGGGTERKVLRFHSDLASRACTLLAGGQGRGTKEKEAVLLDQIWASQALSVSFARPTGSPQLTEFPINKK